MLNDKPRVRLLLLLVSLGLVVIVRDVLLLGFLGILLAVFMSYPVGFLSKWCPRGIAVLIVLFTMLGATVGVSVAMFPQMSEQIQSTFTRLPEAANQIEDWYLRVKKRSSIEQLPQGSKIVNRLGDRLGKMVEAGAAALIPAAKGAVVLVASVVFILVIAAFLVYQPESYKKSTRKLFPMNYVEVFDESYCRLARGLRHWVAGILVAMLIMGLFTAIGLAIAGIDNWLFLGFLTFLGTFVPYLGAISSAIPGLIMGLSQSPVHFLYACFVYLGVHLVEGYIVEPLIMRRAVEIKPAVLLVGQAIFGTLFGIVGIVVAAPFLVCIQVSLEYLYVERYLKKLEDRKPCNDQAA
jgi:predicted PurR-regulated permease PerM